MTLRLVFIAVAMEIMTKEIERKMNEFKCVVTRLNWYKLGKNIFQFIPHMLASSLLISCSIQLKISVHKKPTFFRQKVMKKYIFLVMQ